MTKNVFAGMWEIAAENGMNKSIARFPDVCMSPPSPPAGPIPIPYPDTSFSNNLKSASTTVLIGGKGAALAQKSYYKEPVLGDEAATRTFGANVVTHQITGKTYFQAWCMDVKFEGKNVCRHFDITTSNHASGGTTTAPLMAVEFASLAEAQEFVDAKICPCCGGNLHEWQKDPSRSDGGAYPIMTQKDFWQKKINSVTPTTQKRIDKKADFQKKLDRIVELKGAERKKMAANQKHCPNVHQSDTDGCAIHFDIPKGKNPLTGKTPAKMCSEKFASGERGEAVLKWQAARGKTYPQGEKMNHITSKMAGGCNDAKNVVPNSEMTDPECQEIESCLWEIENEINNFI